MKYFGKTFSGAQGFRHNRQATADNNNDLVQLEVTIIFSLKLWYFVDHSHNTLVDKM